MASITYEHIVVTKWSWCSIPQGYAIPTLLITKYVNEYQPSVRRQYKRNYHMKIQSAFKTAVKIVVLIAIGVVVLIYGLRSILDVYGGTNYEPMAVTAFFITYFTLLLTTVFTIVE